MRFSIAHPTIASSLLRIVRLLLLAALTGCGASASSPAGTVATRADPPGGGTATAAFRAPTADHSAHRRPEALAGGTATASAFVPVQPPAQIRLTGSGESHSQSFGLEPGLAVFQIDHPMSTPLAAFLLNEQGEHLALLANGTARSSRHAVGIRAAGSYTLHVIAQDTWTASVEQPKAEELQRQAVRRNALAGEGSSVARPILLRSGELSVDWKHAGALPATMVLWSVDGRERVEVVANGLEQGGSSRITVPSDHAYVLVVQADGRWSVAFP